MKRIGITGGIGSGKSTVCNLLAQYGVAIYDSDTRAKALMSSKLRPEIEQLFGTEAYIDGVLNRQHIASVVFTDPARLSLLNNIVHPAVAADFELWCDEQTATIVALESAILFESGFDKKVDTTIFIDAPNEMRIARAMERDGKSREEIEARIANQNSNKAHNSSDYIIINDTMEHLQQQIEQLYTELTHNETLTR